MCSPAAIGPAVGAVGNAMAASQANKEKKRLYQHKLKMRERKWMADTTTYKTKKVQFEQEVDTSKIAAQRAYSKVQASLYNNRSLAILQNQEDFKSMLKAEGDIEASAAERGVRGASVARQLVMNSAGLGLKQAMRSRALATASFDAKEAMADTGEQISRRNMFF